VLLVVALVVGGCPVVLMGAVRTDWMTGRGRAVEQPVAFDHRHHVRDDGIPCLYCHSGAERSAWAGIPPTDLCLGCHAQIWSSSPELAPVFASASKDEPIAWQRVHRLPDFVYFNHAAHVDRGVGCASCHGAVDQMARVYQVAPLTMGWCLDCHRDPGPDLQGTAPPTDCSGCHR
jgi:hypothetical protein